MYIWPGAESASLTAHSTHSSGISVNPKLQWPAGVENFVFSARAPIATGHV